jgi:glycosyltransferase involved in cell wall biosynthesis/2-polyprenyl-3-methyl-5-hydroxy-6-metoxy-1,4-benzoquinol methylase
MKKQPVGTYDFPVYYNNVYGHALELLRKRRDKAADGEIHLDIGCGYGRCAEFFRSDFARTYIGIDAFPDGLASLRERGFEGHEVLLDGREETLAILKRVVGSRKVASITFLDTIEHLFDPESVVAAIADFARVHGAWVVVSTANVTHRDIGAKLDFGQWDYRSAGPLDHTHVQLFDDKLFVAVLNNAGLHVVERFDVRVPKSDQYFPADHPGLAPGTTLSELLFTLAGQANEHLITNQFVCLCAPARESGFQSFVADREVERPFLSVVLRTQGRRPHTLVEVLTCFSGQTDTDFELLVVGHKLNSVDSIIGVEQVIDDMPRWIRDKIRLIRVEEGGRSRPLNVGFQEARGRYIAMLDDDDVPFGHYVQTFHRLSEETPDRILRAACVRQDVINVKIGGRTGTRASGPLERPYPSEFDLFDHLNDNRSPNFSLAFPRGAFHDLGYRFDEEVNTAEDWDFLVRVAAVCGVASSPSITGVYRWWVGGESSRSVHSQHEWEHNYKRILEKQDNIIFVLQNEYVSRLRQLVSKAAERPVPGAPAQILGTPLEKSVISDWLWDTRHSLPPELRKMLVKGVRRKISLFKLKYYFYLPFRNRRRRYRACIRAQRETLAQLLTKDWHAAIRTNGDTDSLD